MRELDVIQPHYVWLWGREDRRDVLRYGPDVIASDKIFVEAASRLTLLAFADSQ
jgi:hypothetical protein